MIRILWVVGLLAMIGGGVARAATPPAAGLDEMERSFQTPPDSAKPWVYWWFEGGYGSPEGIARDLAAMKEKGIGGVMHMQTINAGGLPLPSEPKMLSPEWDAWFGEALRLAKEDGLTMGASILDGWAHGGWWVGKEDGSKQLVYSESQVDGPGALPFPLPQPFTRLAVYHDVAVVAFKEKTQRSPVPLEVQANNVDGGYCGEENWPAAHAVDGDPDTYWRTQRPCSPESPAQLDVRYAAPITVTGAMIAGMPKAGPAECEILASDDGRAFRPVTRCTMDPGERKRVTFAETTASHFRLMIPRAYAPDLELAEFQLLRQGDEPVLHHGIKWFDFKSSNRAWWGWPPNPYEALEDEYAEDDASDVSTSDVVDLSSHLQANGRLDWQFPAGRWTVLRFGWTPLAEPARMGSGGYEVDMLNTRGADLMMDTAAQHMRDLSIKFAGGAPIVFHTDSWEIGAGNKGQQPTWTNDFREQFKQRRGYDLLPYLPAMARRLVNDRETTDRFLSDYRATVADLLAAYYGRLQDRAHQMNGRVNPESGYGSYPHPHMDGLQVFGRADLPMAEFWHPFGTYNSVYLQWVDIMRTAASAARIYGRRIVQAETLTFHPTAGQFTPPQEYRHTLHEAWARGLNQAVIHKYVHQPFEEKPGLVDYSILDRHMAWWPLADGFLGYIGRSQYLLQQGDYVADAAYFVGEGATRFVPGKEFLRPALPPGFDYDGINAEVLLTRTSVKDGRLVLPDGLSYRYLVLCDPQCRTLSPALLARIKDLVRSGAAVVGLPPQAAPGLTDRAGAAARIKALVAELWGQSPPSEGLRKVGKGRVIWGREMGDILAADGVKPDLERSAGSDGENRAGLAGASWIWHAADGDNPPPCERLFRASLDIPEGRTVVKAMVSMTVDNSFVFSLNGQEICRGDNFNVVVDADITGFLHLGRNELLVHAVNGGDAPNPAGVIGKLVILLDHGGRIERTTDASWMSSVAGDRWAAVNVEGPLGAGPWGQIEVGAGQTILPVWIHRRTQAADIYFLSNPLRQAVDMALLLRAHRKVVQLFDPLDGSARALPEKTFTADGRTRIPLHFEPEQAFFLVLSDGPAPAAAGRNFPALKPVLTIEGPWQVSFDAKWVKPLPSSADTGAKEVAVVFDQLADWSKRPEDGIKGYSGTAVYRKSFDLPPGDARSQQFLLDLGTVKEMARVEINGRDLGVVWCHPWRARIPTGLLKESGNRLVVTVANTWNNRLCADNALPEKERLTRVGHDLHQQAARNGLQPAGLLGPVRVLAADASR